MATIEEFEEKTTDLSKLIELVEKDDLPTNIFTIEDTDPLVLLGKLNEIIAYLKDMLSLINSSDSKANEALASALQALTTAREAIEGATLALDSSNTALNTANTALNTANTANEKADSANDVANEAMAEASEALMTAQEALSQVVSRLGTKVYDINNNLLSNAKFAGHNGINVDMADEDSETFDIRLDSTITEAIEETNTLANTNKANIDNLTNTQATNIENIEQLQKGQADNDIAIVGLESKTLTHDEEIASLQATTTENSQKLQRALLTPMSTPTSTKLVGVDTNNAQEMLDIGEGLVEDNGTIKVSDDIISGANSGLVELWSSKTASTQTVNVFLGKCKPKAFIFIAKTGAGWHFNFIPFEDVVNKEDPPSVFYHDNRDCYSYGKLIAHYNESTRVLYVEAVVSGQSGFSSGTQGCKLLF